jgi:hypothetical protein
MEMNKSVDYLKTSYNLFYENDGGNNLNISRVMTRNPKSQKKLCVSKNNQSFLEDDISPSYYKTKKFYRNRNSSRKSQDFLNPTNFQTNLFKEHVTTTNGGVLSSKKHYVSRSTSIFYF